MKLAFVGGGNMAHAMLGGMKASGGDNVVHVLEPDADRRAELASEFDLAAHAEPGDWLRDAAVVVLAIKPQQAHQAVSAVVPYVARPMVISIVAGVQGQTLARWLGHQRIVRAMPNTPALIRAGITGAVALADVSADDRAEADRILRSVGQVLWLERESLLDPVTAISGSGPAYVFYFIEALQQAGRDLGFTDEQARQLAVETFSGAASLARLSSEPVHVLRERVTSKGGTTAAALAHLESSQVRSRIIEAVRAACARAEEMGRQFDTDEPPGR